MKNFILTLLVLVVAALANRPCAQDLDLENFDPRQIFGKVLAVKKGYAPKFFLGKSRIPKLDVVGKILGSKNNPEITRLFRTFKTGRTVYKIAAYAGTAVSVYGVVKNISANNRDSVIRSEVSDAKTALYSGFGSLLSGVVVKMLTKGASYKAVDLFGGVIRNKLEEIIGIDLGMKPAHNGKLMLTTGLKIAL